MNDSIQILVTHVINYLQRGGYVFTPPRLSPVIVWISIKEPDKNLFLLNGATAGGIITQCERGGGSICTLITQRGIHGLKECLRDDNHECV